MSRINENERGNFKQDRISTLINTIDAMSRKLYYGLGDNHCYREQLELEFLQQPWIDCAIYNELQVVGIFARDRLRNIPGLHKDELMRVLDIAKHNRSFIDQYYIPAIEVYRQNMDQLAVVTSTFYKDNVEGNTRSQLALQSGKNAQRLGLQSVAIDGGSSEQFLKHIQQLPGMNIINSKNYPQANNMGAERRIALQYALENFPNIPYFLRTEPEKDDLLTVYNLGPMIEHMSEQQYDVIVPQRSKTSKLTLPSFQARTERRANKALYNLMQNKQSSDPRPSAAESMDYFFGPKLMSRSGAKDMLEYNGTSRDGIVLPVIVSFRKGKKVGSYEVDYYYDSKQKELEEGKSGSDQIDEATKKQYMKKRIEQYKFILNQAKNLFLAMD